ncbi:MULTISPECIES: DUF2332 domain-containing protein [Halomicrobium]|uniref:DUF2332 domain-containing protein n=2 Tax=Halomicrobium mukohataei TaxID=57705 RepID=C7NWH3_HALMD|nr:MULTISPECIES: DUF2332 domain-containing protein [Halomicrobium]ACV46314.1 conserved hypothetical protein [Halomicrobium mukohataei DSM 12286]QCD64872.1 DUF2332 domain-containing protein [Halomicrobium mukohataei]QFR19678.1 DUF2332 family protein [Halomicrobium sp. ZPS1]
MTDLREPFLDLAEWTADTSPLYERLCRIVADEPELLTLAETVPADRAVANVFLAAVHCVVRRGVDHPLANYYSSVTDDPRPPDGDLGPALRDFCRTYAGALRPLLTDRRTQTNEVGRCAVLYPAIAHVTAQTEGQIALVEIGPSAGLNLALDRYGYAFRGRDLDEDVRRVGRSDAPVTIRATVEEGTPPLPVDPPGVHSRVGVDLNPMDVTDEADVEWLGALTWPEHDQRRAALSDAVAVARRDPPRLIEGDAIDELPRILDTIPADVPVVVYSTLVLYQLPDEVRANLRDLIATRARERQLHWLTGSGAFDDPGDGLDLRWHRSVAGTLTTDRLARYHPHGQWIEWHADGDR